MPSSWDARPAYKGHVAYATDRGGAFTQAGRVPLGLRPALRHVFETTSVIRGLWKKRMLQHFRVHTWGEIKGNRFQRIPPCALWREPPISMFGAWPWPGVENKTTPNVEIWGRGGLMSTLASRGDRHAFSKLVSRYFSPGMDPNMLKHSFFTRHWMTEVV